MKSREDLEKIARGIAERMSPLDAKGQAFLMVKIIEALQRVQDEALNSRQKFKSKTYIGDWPKSKLAEMEVELSRDVDHYGSHNDELFSVPQIILKRLFERANMKPAPQMPSEEEIEALINDFYKDEPNGYGPKTKLRKLLQKVRGARLSDRKIK